MRIDQSGQKADDQGVCADGVVSIEKACKFLDCSKSSLYRAMDRGDIAYTRIGGSRRIPKLALVELAEANLSGRRNAGSAVGS